MSEFRKKATGVILSNLFIFCLFITLYADKIPCEWDDVEKIIAVGDLHGDYDNFVKILKRAEIVNETLSWIGGKTHLVQTGDIMDRGDHAKEIFDLIKKLEKEAEEAGGKVHMLMGNHEELNITGMAPRQYGYVTFSQFRDFLPDSFIAAREKELEKLLEKASKKENNSNSSIVIIEEFWNKLLTGKNKTAQTARYEYTLNFNKEYGKWILEHNAVIRINDTIFVHGGISKRFSKWSLQKINDTVRMELDMYRIAHKRQKQPPMRKRQVVYESDSPLWFRDFALKTEEDFTQEVNSVLENLGVKHMVIAHTPGGSGGGSPIVGQEPLKILSKFNKKIWVIDTGISDYYAGVLSFLTIKNGKFSGEWWKDEE